MYAVINEALNDQILDFYENMVVNDYYYHHYFELLHIIIWY